MFFLSRLRFFGGSPGGTTFVIASDENECSYIALFFLRVGGRDRGKDLFGESVVGLILC